MMDRRDVQPEEVLCEVMRQAGSEVIRSAFQSFLLNNRDTEDFRGRDYLFNSLESEIRRGLLGIVDAYDWAIRKDDKHTKRVDQSTY